MLWSFHVSLRPVDGSDAQFFDQRFDGGRIEPADEDEREIARIRETVFMEREGLSRSIVELFRRRRPRAQVLRQRLPDRFRNANIGWAFMLPASSWSASSSR
jgi:hypothetical protein